MKTVQQNPVETHWAKKVLEERGIPIAPREHWIYNEGASIAFIPSRKGKKSIQEKKK